ncbi:MAG: hypothetical protein ACXADL_00375 [Candidatus Thorarchaeota archaeon]|jgi:hypothetical protein
MKIVDRLIDIFGRRRRLLLGAAVQPIDLNAQIYAVRAQAYQKITGKRLKVPASLSQLNRKSGVENISSSLSPSRRLLGRGL